MPNNIVKSFAKRTNRTEAEVEGLWNKAKSLVTDDYPDVQDGSEEFYKLLTGVLKRMLSIKTEENPSGGISYSDVKPGTVPFNTYHQQKRRFKKSVNEAFAKISQFDKEELGVFTALHNEGSDIAITMIETAISQDQLKESIQAVKDGTNNSEAKLFLDAQIKEAISDKQKFAGFIERIAEYLYEAGNLNSDSMEYPGYDLGSGDDLISVKSSSSRHTVSEAYRNSNSIKTSALILSTLYRMDRDTYKERCSFKDIKDLLAYKDELLEFTTNLDNSVQFVVSYINKKNELCIHKTNAIKESLVLEHCFRIIEREQGRARSKFCASYSKLTSFTEGDEVIKIPLMMDEQYAELRENIINTISNIKDYELMRKIEMLLR